MPTKSLSSRMKMLGWSIIPGDNKWYVNNGIRGYVYSNGRWDYPDEVETYVELEELMTTGNGDSMVLTVAQEQEIHAKMSFLSMDDEERNILLIKWGKV